MWPKRNINNDLTGKIIALVCEVWGVERADLTGKSRKRPLPWARAQLCHYLYLLAGHDTISCGAVVNKAPEGVVTYFRQYRYNMKTYTEFKTKDALLAQRIKEMRK